MKRIATLTATGVFLVVGAFSALTLLTDPRFADSAGYDFHIYRDAAERWLGGGPFYYPEQFAGPYVTLSGHIMYPPPTLLLFVPFVWLPAIFWWAIPIAIVAAAVWRLRPTMWAWPLMAACLGWPYSVELLYTGNPLLWIVAAMALATRWPAASVLILLKPSLAPFALLGVRHRSWWIALGAFALVSSAFLPMWGDWLRVVLNARGPFSGPLYSVKDLPFMAFPLLAWVASRRSHRFSLITSAEKN